ncbi:hypothetical protein [Streptomyces sp. NBC_01751]|uniref:hypothetical protein n=1 Tax=Streptomyces sp. NBC_01751 TaxID=2975929 RepID=UPI002DDA11B6|nr:hypothetical protein [Streptomyces sp. NBC_01751]WSD24581.1 hypothetical protein OHA26_14400 [Streptomyces sp. NBC_01751]
MSAIKPDTRSVESMAAGKVGEWELKSLPVKSKNARKRAAADAPKRKFANIDGKRVEVRQAPKREARPYPSAPVTARPGSRVAATVLRGNTDPLIKPLPRRGIGPKLEVGRSLTKAEQANHIPFMPEFQAEGQPYPRTARDKDGNVMPRVRTDNGMTELLKGRGIGRREDGKPTYTKRQMAEREAERQAQHATAMEAVRLRDLVDTQDRLRKEAKRGLQYCIGEERKALACGDMERAAWARESIRQYRKAAKFKA